MKESTVGTSVGPATGNAVAYFIIWGLTAKYGITFDDPGLAIAMGGALAGTILLELRNIINFGLSFLPKRKEEEV